MGKYMCICANIVSDTCVPDIGLGYLTSSWDVESRIPDAHRTVYECEKCGALAIEHPFNGSTHKFYMPEDGSPANLFAHPTPK